MAIQMKAIEPCFLAVTYSIFDVLYSYLLHFGSSQNEDPIGMNTDGKYCRRIILKIKQHTNTK